MNEASVTVCPEVSDATCQTFLGLIIRTTSVRPGESTQGAKEQICELCSKDFAFAAWLGKCIPACEFEPTGDLSLRRLAELVAWLPESVIDALDALPVENCELRENLIRATHLAIRTRAMESNLADRLESEKREAIYHLAYGLSHELNNPLANISTRAGVLLQKHAGGEDAELLQAIVDNAMRGCEMLGDLMLVARPPQLETQPVELRPFFDRLLEDARKWASRFDVHLECHMDAGDGEFDPVAMREALWSVLRNAIEASADQSATVTLAVRQQSQTLNIRIVDTGPGLGQQARQHCFDLYYSGREAGRGLGMGLAKAQRIVMLHRGTIRLEPSSSGGCCVLVELPNTRFGAETSTVE